MNEILVKTTQDYLYNELEIKFYSISEHILHTSKSCVVLS